MPWYACVLLSVSMLLVPSQSATNALFTQAPKRGLSVEEKRQKIQQLFHETQDVFQLKVRPPSPPFPWVSVNRRTAIRVLLDMVDSDGSDAGLSCFVLRDVPPV